MKGKRSFTNIEMLEIIDLIEQKVVASKNEQRNIRNKIRSLGFYFSDFSNKKGYNVDDFKELFEKAEASDFLKGANDRNWSATFDWLIKDANMAKVLDGNYSNKAKKKGFNNFEERAYDQSMYKDLIEQ